jgi:hypothetical protein
MTLPISVEEPSNINNSIPLSKIIINITLTQ